MADLRPTCIAGVNGDNPQIEGLDLVPYCENGEITGYTAVIYDEVADTTSKKYFDTNLDSMDDPPTGAPCAAAFGEEPQIEGLDLIPYCGDDGTVSGYAAIILNETTNTTTQFFFDTDLNAQPAAPEGEPCGDCGTYMQENVCELVEVTASIDWSIDGAELTLSNPTIPTNGDVRQWVAYWGDDSDPENVLGGGDLTHEYEHEDAIPNFVHAAISNGEDSILITIDTTQEEGTVERTDVLKRPLTLIVDCNGEVSYRRCLNGDEYEPSDNIVKCNEILGPDPRTIIAEYCYMDCGNSQRIHWEDSAEWDDANPEWSGPGGAEEQLQAGATITFQNVMNTGTEVTLSGHDSMIYHAGTESLRVTVPQGETANVNLDFEPAQCAYVSAGPVGEDDQHTVSSNANIEMSERPDLPDSCTPQVANNGSTTVVQTGLDCPDRTGITVVGATDLDFTYENSAGAGPNNMFWGVHIGGSRTTYRQRFYSDGTEEIINLRTGQTEEAVGEWTRIDCDNAAIAQDGATAETRACLVTEYRAWGLFQDHVDAVDASIEEDENGNATITIDGNATTLNDSSGLLAHYNANGGGFEILDGLLVQNPQTLTTEVSDIEIAPEDDANDVKLRRSFYIYEHGQPVKLVQNVSGSEVNDMRVYLMNGLGEVTLPLEDNQRFDLSCPERFTSWPQCMLDRLAIPGTSTTINQISDWEEDPDQPVNDGVRAQFQTPEGTVHTVRLVTTGGNTNVSPAGHFIGLEGEGPQEYDIVVEPPFPSVTEFGMLVSDLDWTAGGNRESIGAFSLGEGTNFTNSNPDEIVKPGAFADEYRYTGGSDQPQTRFSWVLGGDEHAGSNFDYTNIGNVITYLILEFATEPTGYDTVEFTRLFKKDCRLDVTTFQDHDKVTGGDYIHRDGALIVACDLSDWSTIGETCFLDSSQGDGFTQRVNNDWNGGGAIEPTADDENRYSWRKTDNYCHAYEAEATVQYRASDQPNGPWRVDPSTGAIDIRIAGAAQPRRLSFELLGTNGAAIGGFVSLTFKLNETGNAATFFTNPPDNITGGDGGNPTVTATADEQEITATWLNWPGITEINFQPITFHAFLPGITLFNYSYDIEFPTGERGFATVQVDGQTGELRYINQATGAEVDEACLLQCPTRGLAHSDEFIRLCDDNGPFLRVVENDGEGRRTVFNFELDGETTYEPVGDVGACCDCDKWCREMYDFEEEVLSLEAVYIDAINDVLQYRELISDTAIATQPLAYNAGANGAYNTATRTYYNINAAGTQLHVFDLDNLTPTGTVVNLAPPLPAGGGGPNFGALDPVTGLLHFGAQSSNRVTIDPNTGITTTVPPITGVQGLVSSVSFTRDGRMWAGTIDGPINRFYEVDKATGVATLSGTLPPNTNLNGHGVDTSSEELGWVGIAGSGAPDSGSIYRWTEEDASDISEVSVSNVPGNTLDVVDIDVSRTSTCFSRCYTRDKDGNVTFIDTDEDGNEIDLQGRAVSCLPPEASEVVDIELVVLCDDNGPFIRRIRTDSRTGDATFADLQLDGSTAYTTVGTVERCSDGAGGDVDVTTQDRELICYITNANPNPQQAWARHDDDLVGVVAPNVDPAGIAYFTATNPVAPLDLSQAGLEFVLCEENIQSSNHTPTRSEETGAGSTTAGAHSIAITNVGAAAGTVAGAPLLPGETFEVSSTFDHFQNLQVYVNAVAYDATGTTFHVAELI